MYVYLPTYSHSPLDAVVTHSQLQLSLWLYFSLIVHFFTPPLLARVLTPNIQRTTSHITHHTSQNSNFLLLLLQNTRPRDPHSHQRSRRRERVLRERRRIVAEQRTRRRSDARLQSRRQGRHDTRRRLFGRYVDDEKADVWEQTDLLPEETSPDADWCARARRAGGGGGHCVAVQPRPRVSASGN